MKYFFMFFAKKILCFALFALLFFSCIKDDVFDFKNVTVKLDGTWGISLLNADASFADFIIDSTLSITSENNIVRMIYSVPMITSGNIEDLLPMSNYQWSFSISDIEEPITAPETNLVIFSGSQDVLFYEDTTQIIADSVVFKSGNFQFVVNNTFDHEFRFRVKSNYFHYPNGKTLDTLVTIPYNVNNFSIKLDLAGCRVKLRRNSLPCDIEMIAYNDGHIFSGGKKRLDIDVHGDSYMFKLIRGKVKTIAETIRTEADFSTNIGQKNSLSANTIRGGKIRINSSNSFGTEISLDIDTCELVAKGVPVNLIAPSTSFSLEPAPTYFASRNQSFTINLNDFSIAENNIFRFVGTAYVNEPGIDGPNIFATDNSMLSMNPSLEVPLNFNLNYFIYRDTISVDISDFGDYDFLEKLVLRIDATNEIPVELGSQFYFLDANYRVLDSIFSKAILIPAAKTNSSQNYITAVAGKTGELFVEINHAKLNKIYNAKYICINARATSNNQQTVVRDDQKLKMRVGAKAVLSSIKINETSR